MQRELARLLRRALELVLERVRGARAGRAHEQRAGRAAVRSAGAVAITSASCPAPSAISGWSAEPPLEVVRAEHDDHEVERLVRQEGGQELRAPVSMRLERVVPDGSPSVQPLLDDPVAIAELPPQDARPAPSGGYAAPPRRPRTGRSPRCWSRRSRGSASRPKPNRSVDTPETLGFHAADGLRVSSSRVSRTRSRRRSAARPCVARAAGRCPRAPTRADVLRPDALQCGLPRTRRPRSRRDCARLRRLRRSSRRRRRVSRTSGRRVPELVARATRPPARTRELSSSSSSTGRSRSTPRFAGRSPPPDLPLATPAPSRRPPRLSLLSGGARGRARRAARGRGVLRLRRHIRRQERGSHAAMLDAKLDNILAAGADVVCACDASCLMQIGGGLRRRGRVRAGATISRRCWPRDAGGARARRRAVPAGGA